MNCLHLHLSKFYSIILEILNDVATASYTICSLYFQSICWMIFNKINGKYSPDRHFILKCHCITKVKWKNTLEFGQFCMPIFATLKKVFELGGRWTGSTIKLTNWTNRPFPVYTVEMNCIKKLKWFEIVHTTIRFVAISLPMHSLLCRKWCCTLYARISGISIIELSMWKTRKINRSPLATSNRTLVQRTHARKQIKATLIHIFVCFFSVFVFVWKSA